jgi:NADH:ubiquinone oxidoreductase subunit H
MTVLIVVIKALLIAVPLLIAVAYFTLVDRKIMAGIQR